MRLSASRIALFMECVWFAQDGVQWTDAGPEDERKLGRAFARWVERKCEPTARTLAEEFDLNEEQVDKLERMMAGWSLFIADRVPMIASREITFAWNVRTGECRVLGESLDREYEKAGLTEDELVGSADLAWLDGDCIVIPDVKTGHQGGSVDAALAKAMWQLATLAVMGAKAWQVSRARVMAIHVPEDGDAVFREEELSAEDLADAEGMILDRIALARDGFEPEPTPGEHCKGMWCPAAGVCPTLREADALIPASALLPQAFKLTTEIESPTHHQWTVGVVSAVKQALKAIEVAVDEYTDQAGGRVEYDDGSAYVRKHIPTERPDLSKPGAEALIVAAGAAAAIDREPTSSWAAMERVIGKKAAAGLRAQMSEVGATKKGGYPKYALEKARVKPPKRDRRIKVQEVTRASDAARDEFYADTSPTEPEAT